MYRKNCLGHYCCHILKDREYERLIDRARVLVEERTQGQAVNGVAHIALKEASPNSLNGYRRLSLSRIAQLIAYFEEQVGNLYKTKLNKLLFYADFLAYKLQAYSITGLQYRAIPYGPVPSEYQRLFLRLQDENQVHVEEIEGSDDQYFELFHPCEKFQPEEFSPQELQALETVARLAKGKRTHELVALSHEEEAWKKNILEKQLIDYQRYSFGLLV